MKKELAITLIVGVSMFVATPALAATPQHTIKDLRLQVHALQHRNNRQARMIKRLWRMNSTAYNRGMLAGYKQTMIEFEQGDYDGWMIIHLTENGYTIGC